MEINLKLSDIVVEGRLREDLGDIEGLAESIRDNGLLQALVVECSPLGVYGLRAGGRRHAALTLLRTNKVENSNPDFYDTVPCRIFSEMPESTRTKIEVEENLRRKDMSWQEYVIGVARYHRACKREAILAKETWSEAATGELLGMSQASVNIATRVAAELQAGNEGLAKCENLAKAVQLLASQKLDELQAEQMRRIQEKRKQLTLASTQDCQAAPASALPRLPSGILASAPAVATLDSNEKQQYSKEEIAAFYHHGDSLEVLRKLKTAGTRINHIICDPPYGINVDNLVSDSITRIEETHQVTANVQLLEQFLQVAYEVIENDGFLCMWYDLDHHEKIYTWATRIGWRVQRWPLVWCKTSPCQNSQAQYNITKSTEVCYFMRRSEQSIIKNKRSNNFITSPRASSSTHPFVKPDDVWGYLIDTVSEVGETVVDPFAGEGSSLAAIFKRRRVPVGIEIDATHIASGLSYIQGLINQKGLLDGMMEEPPL